MNKIPKIIILTLFVTVISSCKKDSPADPVLSSPVDTDILLTDVDGNTYKTKKIGNTTWMIENFKAARSSAGQKITEVYVYNNNDSSAAVFGRLYTWSAAVEAAPAGWRLPTKEEWEGLINTYGGAAAAGGSLKETGTARWNSPNTGATNVSGLTAVAGGFRGGDSVYYDFGRHGSYWGTAENAREPFCVYLYNTAANVITEVSPIDKTSGIAFAVRYVKK